MKLFKFTRKFIQFFSTQLKKHKLRNFFLVENRKNTDFDVLHIPDDFVFNKFFENYLILDDDLLSDLYKSLDKIGSRPAESGGKLLRGITKKFSIYLAKMGSSNSSEKAHAFADAWYFSLWRELSILIPVKHLARKISRTHKNTLIFLPLKNKHYSYLKYCNWSISNDDIEPFLLAYALRKEGAAVTLLVSGNFFNEIESSFEEKEFIFNPSSSWFSSNEACSSKRESNEIFVEDGIRNPEWIRNSMPNAIKMKSMLTGDSKNQDIQLWGAKENPKSFSIPLHISLEMPNGLKVYTPRSIFPKLSNKFLEALVPLSEMAYSIAQKSVSQSKINSAYICDHLFFESAIMADAVRRSGGEVHLLPHSINDTFFQTHQKISEVSSIYSITKNMAAEGQKKSPKSNSFIRSEIMLTPIKCEQNFISNQPITVIIFGGAHALTRFPLVPPKKHEETWSKLLKKLALYPEDIRVIFKSKSAWESADWLSSLSSEKLSFEESLIHAKEINFPNMIFMSVSVASAALMEGLGRGIPCMIAREIDAEDYMHMDPDIIPIKHVDDIINKLILCKNPEYFNDLLKKQLDWYNSETSFQYHE